MTRLWQRLKDARARDLVVQSHLRFVIKQAHRKTKDRDALKDYIAAGNLGLLKAIEPGHFDPDRRPYIRFLTYAGSWIYKEMMDVDYATSSVVHVPTHKQKEQRRKAHALRIAATLHGPGSKEAEAVGYVTNPIVSLDEIRDDELATEAEAASECHVRQLADLLEGVLAKLPEREALVIRLHYGVKDEPRNLAQIAKVMGISPESVRLLRVRALGMVRHRLVADQESVDLLTGFGALPSAHELQP